MATAIASPLSAWAPHHQAGGLSWPDHHLGYHHPQHIMTAYIPTLPTPAPIPQTISHHRHTSASQPSQSAAWTTEEDNRLMDAKAQGYGWNEIQKRYFPNKSGNACRKRHERLMTKLRTTDWDETRIRKVIAEYNVPGFRERFWRTLSDRVDERWEDVERVCFQQGLKGLRASRPYHTRGQSRASSGPGATSEYERGSSQEYDNDDSGIGLGGSSRRSSKMRQSTTASVYDNVLRQPVLDYRYN